MKTAGILGGLVGAIVFGGMAQAVPLLSLGTVGSQVTSTFTSPTEITAGVIQSSMDPSMAFFQFTVGVTGQYEVDSANLGLHYTDMTVQLVGAPGAFGPSNGDAFSMFVHLATGTTYTLQLSASGVTGVDVTTGNATFDVIANPATVTPLPGTLILFGSVVAGAGAFVRRRKSVA